MSGRKNARARARKQVISFFSQKPLGGLFQGVLYAENRPPMKLLLNLFAAHLKAGGSAQDIFIQERGMPTHAPENGWESYDTAAALHTGDEI
jgi:hypothetical protein